MIVLSEGDAYPFRPSSAYPFTSDGERRAAIRRNATQQRHEGEARGRGSCTVGWEDNGMAWHAHEASK